MSSDCSDADADLDELFEDSGSDRDFDLGSYAKEHGDELSDQEHEALAAQGVKHKRVHDIVGPQPSCSHMR